MYIYKTTNTVNGKIYIGQCSKTPEKSKNYFGSGLKINLAIEKHGKEKFTKEILKQNIKTQKALDALEFMYIKKFNSTDRSVGYNILTGSANGFNNANPMDSPEVREKISGENHYLYGKKRSEEEKKSLSEVMTGDKNPNFGNKWSEEQKENLSKKKKGKPNLKLIGFKHSEKTKKKMSESGKIKIFTEEHKRNMSEAMTGEGNPFFGKKHSEHSLNKMSEVQNDHWNDPVLGEQRRQKASDKMKGKKHSEETKIKIGKSGIGRIKSPETIAKTVAWHTGKKRSPEAKKRIRMGILLSKMTDEKFSIFTILTYVFTCKVNS